MNICERIVVHRLLKIDGIENLNLVIFPHKHVSNFIDDRALRKRFVNTENDNSL